MDILRNKYYFGYRKHTVPFHNDGLNINFQFSGENYITSQDTISKDNKTIDIYKDIFNNIWIKEPPTFLFKNEKDTYNYILKIDDIPEFKKNINKQRTYLFFSDAFIFLMIIMIIFMNFYIMAFPAIILLIIDIIGCLRISKNMGIYLFNQKDLDNMKKNIAQKEKGVISECQTESSLL